MDESDHPTKPAPETPTPDVAQLLKLIDLQTAAQRDRRAAFPKAFQGSSFRWGSIIVIVVFTLGSVCLMEYIISQLPRPGQGITTVQPANPPAISSKSATLSGISGQKASSGH